MLGLLFVINQNMFIINSKEPEFQNNYTNYEFNQYLKGDLSLTSEPMITFLTPGLSVDATTWGINDNIVQNYSLISYMQRRGADVFVVTNRNNDSESPKSYFESNLNDIRVSHIYNDNYDVNLKNKLTNPSPIDKIKFDTSKPVVIVFNPLMINEGLDIYDKNRDNLYNRDDEEIVIHDSILQLKNTDPISEEYKKLKEILDNYNSKSEAYNELESVVNAVIYKYMLDSDNLNICPKINMVGHSRGGLLNLLYSMEHPNVVDTLISVGTPYNGSNLGEIPGAIGLLDLFSSVINDVPLTYDEIEKN